MKWKPVLKKNYHQLIFVFIAFLLMILVSIISVNAITRQKLLNASDEALHTVEANIKMNLQEPEATLVGASFTVQNMIANQKAPQNEILQYLTGLTDWLMENEERVSGFNGIYGVIRGDYLDGMGWEPPTDYIPQERPWYIAAKEKVDDIAMTAPYIDAQTQVGIISFSKELQDPDGKSIGVISLDVMLTRLTEYVSSLQQSYGGYGILLDSDFNVVAHPIKEYAGISLEALSGDYVGIATELKTGADVTGKTIYDTDGRRMILFFRKLYNGWYVGMLTPFDSYYSEMYRMEAILIIMGSVLMLALSLILMRLAAAKMRSDEENRSKSSFLARMSHEIRTPMNAIIGMTELMLRKELPPDAREEAVAIKQAGANLLSIINDILDFSKIEAGNLEIISADYLFSSLINDVVSIIRMKVMNTHIRFVVNIDSNIPNALIGDEIRIRQVLLNLLSNAVKYTEEGFVSIAVTGEMTSDDTVMLTIEVADSGRGVKEEDIEKLFGEFVQIDLEKNKGIEGTGLGLAITKNFVKAMGGDISLRSEYGKGSTFTVTLPQRFREYEKLASVENPEEKSVLVYERREVYANSIIYTLENLGINCTIAETESEFYEKMEGRNYSFVWVSSFLLQNAKRVITRLDVDAKIVLLTEFGEEVAEQNLIILSMPIYAISVANVLNGVSDSFIYSENQEHGVRFIAPTAKILIVDDINTNLKVAEGLMLPYKMHIDLCKSGMEAIEAVKSSHYDIVFMDQMMPEMDGLEATRKIRAMEGGNFKSLPIIALTANAVSGVREMFIQNGMNDFLAKPIETTKLNAILEKWIHKDKRVKVNAVEQPEEKSDFVDVLKSVPQLSVDKALAIVGGSVNTYERIVRLSTRLMPENIARLGDLFDTDLPNYAIEVHGIKGVLNNIGAYELGMKAFELEERSKNGDLKSLKELHPGFIDELGEFSDSMSALIDKTDVSDKAEGDLSLFGDTLQKLIEAADYYDSALALEILSSVSGCTFGQEIDKVLEELTRAFEGFDFDKAAELLERLKVLMETRGMAI